jgi:hypothetical protein
LFVIANSGYCGGAVTPQTRPSKATSSMFGHRKMWWICYWGRLRIESNHARVLK